MVEAHDLTESFAVRSEQELLDRNAIFKDFFEVHAGELAAACHEMARRFLAGGRLLSFGQGAAATDVQHVTVEFIHPVIVGKRALPALDLGPNFETSLPVLLQAQDMVMGFAFAGADPAVERALRAAHERGALCFALGGDLPSPLATGGLGKQLAYSFPLPAGDPFICQEIFEVLYHLLWETVHVYFEHREQGHDVGASSFLYPFLGKREQPLESVVEDVRRSMLQKVEEVNTMRTAAARTESRAIADTATAIVQRVRQGGKIIAFGNGGSATDANDFVIDCVAPPAGFRPIPAISLAAEPANITAIANDIGSEAIFLRQLIAHAQAGDVAVCISTSGGSANLLSALAEARKLGLLTVALVGYDGGRIVSERLVDHALVVQSDYVPRIQEVQASMYHVLRRRIHDCLLT
ncbi:MAG: SIS domain-containing protein [Armatimonadota bacterium]|nr:SIS domain-containing protein [Armatimonadota bacterium]